ncbi:ErfK/YbiS/YcfS/YnhG family protein [Desulfofarcimen acetoxidans DSM 771]|uniref:ErfK/YbiS/YcfS/YnhG family protein n=2 Tax=Desulfofarcimen acetoxidans TaxID=58138 RepID=C8VY38_DESAS|nr:ErfK/YbiS/YcfS/YnhG family protein [Desulfofarcimen acetoxidans DSM 771]
MMKQKISYFALVLAGLIMLAAIFYSLNSGISAQASSGAERYTVKAGDSLFIIAGKYGIPVAALKQANGLKSDWLAAGQVLIIPLNSSTGQSKAKSLKAILAERGITDPWSTLKIVINKTNHSLSIVYKNTWLKTYPVDIGSGGLADKQVQGDLKTPEGTFYIAEKSVLSPADYYLGTRWMRLSYPNAEDAGRGVRQGLINSQTGDSIVNAINAGKIPPQRTALGGGVGIHGGDIPSFGKDWTWGCIGLSNGDVEDFYDYVSVGTTVIITK